MKKKILIVTIISLFVDQITKFFSDLYLPLYDSMKVIDKYFYLTNCHNFGAAFSILNSKRLLLIITGIIALYIVYTFIKDFNDNRINIIAFGFLFGGIMGNLIDRVFLGYVRDFLDFKIFGYNYPVFNMADSFIVIGAGLMIISVIKGDKNGSSSKRK